MVSQLSNYFSPGSDFQSRFTRPDDPKDFLDAFNPGFSFNSGLDSSSNLDFGDAVQAAKDLGGAGSLMSPGSQSSFAGAYGQDDDDSASDSYTSQFSKMVDAANKAQMWKKLTSGGGYKGAFAQGMGGSPISGGSYQSLGKDKGIFQYQPAQIAGIVHPAPKQKKRGLLGTLGGLAMGAAGAGFLGPWGYAAGALASGLDS